MKVGVLIPFMAFIVLMAACTGPAPAITSRSSPTPAPIATSMFDPDSLVTDDVSQRLMADSLGTIIEGNSSAAREMGASGDKSFIPVLVEFLRFPGQLSHATKVTLRTELATLVGLRYDELTSAQFDWDWWVKWLGDHPEVRPPAGFAGWKGRLFSKLVGPEMGAFRMGRRG